MTSIRVARRRLRTRLFTFEAAYFIIMRMCEPDQPGRDAKDKTKTKNDPFTDSNVWRTIDFFAYLNDPKAQPENPAVFNNGKVAQTFALMGAQTRLQLPLPDPDGLFESETQETEHGRIRRGSWEANHEKSDYSVVFMVGPGPKSPVNLFIKVRDPDRKIIMRDRRLKKELIHAETGDSRKLRTGELIPLDDKDLSQYELKITTPDDCVWEFTLSELVAPG